MNNYDNTKESAQNTENISEKKVKTLFSYVHSDLNLRRELGLSDANLHELAYIVAKTTENHGGKPCFVSKERLAVTLLTNRRTIQRRMKALEKAGIIERNERDELRPTAKWFEAVAKVEAKRQTKKEPAATASPEPVPMATTDTNRAEAMNEAMSEVITGEPELEFYYLPEIEQPAANTTQTPAPAKKEKLISDAQIELIQNIVSSNLFTKEEKEKTLEFLQNAPTMGKASTFIDRLKELKDERKAERKTKPAANLKTGTENLEPYVNITKLTEAEKEEYVTQRARKLWHLIHNDNRIFYEQVKISFRLQTQEARDILQTWCFENAVFHFNDNNHARNSFKLKVRQYRDKQQYEVKRAKERKKKFVDPAFAAMERARKGEGVFV